MAIKTKTAKKQTNTKSTPRNIDLQRGNSKVDLRHLNKMIDSIVKWIKQMALKQLDITWKK